MIRLTKARGDKELKYIVIKLSKTRGNKELTKDKDYKELTRCIVATKLWRGLYYGSFGILPLGFKLVFKRVMVKV